MQGIELAERFYEECRPELYAKMPDLMAQACAGLCGEGSECFGCDDAASRDHDFAPLFCLWLPDELLSQNRKLVETVFASLPETFMGGPSGIGLPLQGRRGPCGITEYFRFFTGLDRPPQNWREWLSIPEFQLAAATNGVIFEDNGGLYSTWRKTLLTGYPEDIRLKKLAARCMQMAQSGQYNLPRCVKRGEYAAAMLAASRFIEAAIAFVFLANRRYMPFYKWAPRLGRKLPVLGHELGEMLDKFTEQALKNAQKTQEIVENFCTICARWLNANNLSHERDNWLWAHGPQIIALVKNSELQAMDLLNDSPL